MERLRARDEYLATVKDADRNRARAGGYQRPAAAFAGRRRQLAAHVSRASVSQLSAVFLGPVGLAHRHLDATNRHELVRLRNHKFKVPAWRGRRGRLGADDVVFDLGRVSG